MMNESSRRWRPRSLIQLVLLAFIVVMLPIALLMFEAGQALSQLSQLADESARRSVEETRRARSITDLSFQMERNARQYAVLQDASLRHLYGEKSRELGVLLKEHAQLMKNNPAFSQLLEHYEQLKALPATSEGDMAQRIQQIAQLGNDADAVRDATNAVVDHLIESIQQRALKIRTELWFKTAGLVSVSLVLMLFFTWLITRPIRQLEKRILNLGSGDATMVGEKVQGPAELVRLNERLNWLAERLNELEEQKQQFLRHMSHELKTPLASVREGAALLSEGIVGELTPRQHEIADLIDLNSKELQSLIEQLLDYNLLQSDQLKNQQQLIVVSFDLRSVIQDVLNKHKLVLESKKLKLSVPDHALPWQADKARSQRVLDNLVSNAIAYGDEGGEIAIRVEHTADQLQIDVANSGQPINSSDQKRLFEPFYQGKAKRNGPLKGSGIGLSVARDCARLQNGNLVLIDDSYYSVCFRFTLPWHELPETSFEIDD